MGFEVALPDTAPLSLEALARVLAAAAVPAMIVMVDGAFVQPGKPLPAAWSDVRLRTPDGTLTLARRGAGVALVVFGNADEKLRAAQARIAAVLRGPGVRL